MASVKTEKKEELFADNNNNNNNNSSSSSSNEKAFIGFCRLSIIDVDGLTKQVKGCNIEGPLHLSKARSSNMVKQSNSSSSSSSGSSSSSSGSSSSSSSSSGSSSSSSSSGSSSSSSKDMCISANDDDDDVYIFTCNFSKDDAVNFLKLGYDDNDLLTAWWYIGACRKADEEINANRLICQLQTSPSKRLSALLPEGGDGVVESKAFIPFLRNAYERHQTVRFFTTEYKLSTRIYKVVLQMTAETYREWRSYFDSIKEFEKDNKDEKKDEKDEEKDKKKTKD